MLHKALNNYQYLIKTTGVSMVLVIVALIAANMLQPHRYSLNLVDPTSAEEISGENFLFLNTNKNQYLPGETVEVSIHSIDSRGIPLCNSALQLYLVDEKGAKTEIAAVRTAACGQNNNDPGFSASFQPTALGHLSLSLKNQATGAVATKKIVVSENAQISVQRSGASSIATGKDTRYPMIISISSSTDTTATIVEKFPTGLDIVWYGNAKASEDQLTWTVDLKAGETVTLPYEYSVSTIEGRNSYTLGQLEIKGASGNTLYSESNPWNLAVTKGSTEN